MDQTAKVTGDEECDWLSMTSLAGKECRRTGLMADKNDSPDDVYIAVNESEELNKDILLSKSISTKCSIVETVDTQKCSVLCREKLDNVDEGIETLLINDDDDEYFDDVIFQQDHDGDNLLFMSIIDERISLACGLISLASESKWFGIYNKFYQTALHLASLMNIPTIVRRLVVAGACVDQRDRNGNTALHLACTGGHVDVAEALLTPVTYYETKLNAYGIPYQKIPQNLEIRNSNGLTCLHLAVMEQNTSLISLLISKEADINTVEMKAGKTCLHIAAEHGDQLSVCALLNDSRCKKDKETFAGYTAAELASYRGDHTIERLLCNHGASKPRDILSIERGRVFNDIINDENTVEIIELSSDEED